MKKFSRESTSTHESTKSLVVCYQASTLQTPGVHDVHRSPILLSKHTYSLASRSKENHARVVQEGLNNLLTDEKRGTDADAKQKKPQMPLSTQNSDTVQFSPLPLTPFSQIHLSSSNNFSTHNSILYNPSPNPLTHSPTSNPTLLNVAPSTKSPFPIFLLTTNSLSSSLCSTIFTVFSSPITSSFR